jgi:hypothetical protein
VPLRRGGLNLRAFRQVKIESELRELTVRCIERKLGVVVDTQRNSNPLKRTRVCRILRAVS